MKWGQDWAGVYTRKDSDTGDNQPDIKEPAEVVSARESIATLTPHCESFIKIQ